MNPKSAVARPDHLAHLERRHKSLKEEISEALTHTSPVEFLDATFLGIVTEFAYVTEI